MIKVAIVEDEDSAANVLMGFLEMYAAVISEMIIYVRYNCTTVLFSEYDGYDIVFMDINIANDMNGIKAAHKLRQKDSVVTLIFITSFEQFAVKGYEVEAFDFIVKPVVYTDFALRMGRAVKHVQKEKLDVLSIKNDGKINIVSVRDIKYVEVIKHKLLFHTVAGIIEGTGSLRETENQLAEKYFVRCNKCYLVNLWYVRGMDGFSVNVDGEELIISRPRKKEFLSELNRYLAK